MSLLTNRFAVLYNGIGVTAAAQLYELDEMVLRRQPQRRFEALSDDRI